MDKEFEKNKSSLFLENPLVTITIPTHNNPRRLRNALRYLTNQTYNNIEIIVSENCAPNDETRKVVEDYMKHDKRIYYYRHKKNIGAWLNFKSALNKGSGKYFMWACTDDEWHSTYVERCMKVLLQQPKLDMVITSYRVISEKGGFFNEYRPKINFNFFSELDRKDALSLFILMDDSTHKANLILGLWKRSSLKEVMECLLPLYEKYEYWKGLDISILVYALTKIEFYQIPEKLFIKKYEQAAPGSLINRAKGICDKFVNLFFRFGKAPDYYNSVNKQNNCDIDMVEEVLKIRGFKKGDFNKIILLKRSLFYLPLELRVAVTALIVSTFSIFYRLRSSR